MRQMLQPRMGLGMGADAKLEDLVSLGTSDVGLIVPWPTWFFILWWSSDWYRSETDAYLGLGAYCCALTNYYFGWYRARWSNDLEIQGWDHFEIYRIVGSTLLAPSFKWDGNVPLVPLVTYASMVWWRIVVVLCSTNLTDVGEGAYYYRALSAKQGGPPIWGGSWLVGWSVCYDLCQIILRDCVGGRWFQCLM